MTEMKITPEVLREQMEELYVYYLKRLRQHDERQTPQDAEAASQAYGAMHAIGALYLACFGGKAMYTLWTRSMEEEAADVTAES